MSDITTRVAFIGPGAMGFGMATRLVKKGYQVTGSEVWGPTLERFKQMGDCASTPAEAAKGKEYCVCMVATAQQAQDALLDGPDPAVPVYHTAPFCCYARLCLAVTCKV